MKTKQACNLSKEVFDNHLSEAFEHAMRIRRGDTHPFEPIFLKHFENFISKNSYATEGHFWVRITKHKNCPASCNFTKQGEDRRVLRNSKFLKSVEAFHRVYLDVRAIQRVDECEEKDSLLRSLRIFELKLNSKISWPDWK